MEDTAQRIPWFEPSFDDRDADRVREVVSSTFVNEGQANREFEEILKAYFNVPYARMTPSCTTALALSLMSLGIGKGDTVLVPALTFIGSASAVRLCGAEPILVDVNPQTFTIDPQDAARRIDSTTKAILPVHLNGRSADLSALRELIQRHGLLCVEDAAEALGSRNAAGFLGTQSDAGCFSLAPTKIITSGQGGFVLTSRQDVFESILRLKDHGRLTRNSDVHAFTGFNFKVSDMQAALALTQWEKLPQRIARSLEIDTLYREGLKDTEQISFPSRPTDGGYLMWPDFTCDERDPLVEHMLQANITLRPFWPALHTQPAYLCEEPFPGAEESVAKGCWLPCSPAITDAEIQRVIQTMIDFFKHQ